jgi:hypothetical protein
MTQIKNMIRKSKKKQINLTRKLRINSLNQSLRSKLIEELVMEDLKKNLFKLSMGFTK